MESQGKRAKVFNAAARLFLEKGYQATSIADIAAQVGMLKGALYYYIRSKDDLLCQVILDALESAEASLLQDAGGREETANIEARIKAHFEYLSRNHIGLGLLLREAEQLPRVRRATIKNRLEAYERALTQTLRTGQSRDVVIAGDPSAIARVMIAASTWTSWENSDPAKQAFLNEGVLRLVFVRPATAEPRTQFSPSHNAALTVVRDILQFESAAEFSPPD